MSKKKTRKKTQEEKAREFSRAVAEKSEKLANDEKKREEFTRVVEEKTQQLANDEKKREEFKQAVEEKNRQLARGDKKTKESAKPQDIKDGNALSGIKAFLQSDNGGEKELARAALSVSAAAKYIIIIAIVGGVSVAGIVMCVLNILNSRWFFAADYLIAALLGLSIVVVKVNTLFPTFVACDGKNLVMRSYDNNVVPYNISGKAAFLCDFIPAKLKTTRLPADKISYIMIGTKNYIKRHCGENSSFLSEIEKIEKSNIGKNTLLAMDMIYIELSDGKSAFMSVDRFDAEGLAAVVRECMKASPDMQMLCNNKYLRNKILFDLPSK